MNLPWKCTIFKFRDYNITTVENKLMQVIVLKEAKILESKCDMCNLKILNQSIQILKAVMFNI